MGWSYLTTKAMQDQAMQLLFGRTAAGFAWGRIPMGASDYAMDRYTDDEVASGSTDPDMTSFSIARDKQRLIPYIKAAQAVKSEHSLLGEPVDASHLDEIVARTRLRATRSTPSMAAP